MDFKIENSAFFPCILGPSFNFDPDQQIFHPNNFLLIFDLQPV